MKTANLTPKQAYYRKSLLKHVHTAKHYVNYFKHNEDEYRDMLEESFGKRSAAELNITQLKNLVAFLEGETTSLLDLISTQQENYMRHQWMQHSREKNIPALLRFIEQKTGKKVISTNAITKQEARLVLGAIQNMKSHNMEGVG